MFCGILNALIYPKKSPTFVRQNEEKRMKVSIRHFYLCLCVLLGFTACDKEDTPAPVLNRLTRVSCYEQEEAIPVFSATIAYNDPDGKINSVRLTGESSGEWLFMYADGKLLVTSVQSTSTLMEYGLSGEVIVSRKISQENPQVSHAMYVSDEFSYHYSGSKLAYTSWVTTWPVAGGGYESRTYAEYERYTWENNNIVRFAQSQDAREMCYEYGTQVRPANFPLRVIGDYNPVGFEAISPLNLLYGQASQCLPVRAYTYAVPNVSQILSEYTYSYIFTGDYITQMTIEQKNYSGTGALEGTKRYVYTFEYNYAKP